MPPVSTTPTPATIRPYIFHRVHLDWSQSREHALGDCPFCQREAKFSVRLDNGLWRCLICNVGSEKGGGNAYTFIRELWKLGASQTTADDYLELVQSRNLVYPETPKLWGLVKCPTTGEWLVPTFNKNKQINQLYRYANVGGRMVLMATSELGHQMFGFNLTEQGKQDAYLCEGPWDGMALWEMLRVAKRLDDGRLVMTANPTQAMLANANVLAAPGCNVFPDAWAAFFPGRRLKMMFDNDEPKVNGRKIEPPYTGSAGYDGMVRVASIVAKADDQPSQIEYIRWGDGGYNPELGSGTDVRDILGAATSVSERLTQLDYLLDHLEAIPDDWIVGRTKSAVRRGSLDMDCTPCSDYKTCINAWRRAVKLIDGLEVSFSVMLASLITTEAVGDQLWVKIIGPAACGKSTLCEALSVNKSRVIAKSTIRGFHSGFKTDRDGEEDHSLIAIAKGKTLIIKDGDTLLQSPNLSQILSEARDIYDRVSRTHYRHGLNREYEGINMTIILCGTGSLRALDTSELGERFLDCCVVDDVDEVTEEEIGWRVANRTAREIGLRSDGKLESRDGPEMVLAKQLTGGYVEYLRENAMELLGSVDTPEEALRQCQRLALFIAHMRARPSKAQKEKAERELSYRLTGQLVRLAIALAAVLNRPSLDTEVMRRVRKVALDTSRGRTLNLLKLIIEKGPGGESTPSLALHTGHTESEERDLLKFLRKIKVLDLFTPVVGGAKQKPRWRATTSMRELYEEVVNQQLPTDPTVLES